VKPLSHITETFTESVIREMTRICDAAGGYNLSQGFPDFAASEEIKQAAIDAIARDCNQYPVTFGEPKLRSAIARKAARYNHINCNPVINPGDEVVVFEPFYENYGPDAILSGATPRYVTLRPPEWDYDPAEMAAAFNGRTKAIIINTPNNPTGKVFSRQEMTEIAALCQQWDCLAITDEIYEHILYDGREHVSIAALDGMAERTVTINSISKTYSVTGWRVGWAIAEQRITQRIRKVHDFLTVGAPTPFQEAASVALAFPDGYYENLRVRYDRARSMLYDLLNRTGFTPYLPRGAYYIMAGTDQLMKSLGVSDDFAFSRKLIEQARVATVPGTSFYASPGKGMDQVRFCFCKKRETLDAVAEQFERLRGMLS
jgi:aspartate/methionine/tyrosine aminotransferase